jgi:hypothetical protein
MGALHHRRPALSRTEAALTAGAATLATGALAIFGERRLGGGGVLLPLALVLVVLLLRRPLAAVATAITLAVVCEGPSFGIPAMTKLYKEVYKGFTPLDMLVLLAGVAVVFDIIRTRRGIRMPAMLGLPMAFIALAMGAGFATTSAGGVSFIRLALMLHVLAYLLFVPVLVANLGLDRRQLRLVLGGAVALAIFKAVLGLIVMASGGSVEIDAGTRLTYYEPTANWLILISILGILAALLRGIRVPRWMLLGLPLLIASDVLSYRRSFWIASVLGLLLMLLFATAPRRRRLMFPAVLLIASAIWFVGSTQFQASTPLAKRVTSLQPSKLQSTAEDRYRLDERANVEAAIRRNAIEGIGLAATWTASARPLPVEHVGGRGYVHFALLWWWLKLGILGAVAYLSVLLGGLLLGWRGWWRGSEPIFRCFGLASLCGIAGLVAIETTASFTGVDPRFTLLFAAQLGLLAAIASEPSTRSLRGRP